MCKAWRIMGGIVHKYLLRYASKFQFDLLQDPHLNTGAFC